MSDPTITTAGRKRARTDLELDDSKGLSLPEGQDDTNLERSVEFWYDDGTVVLIAQGKAYRVYRGLLAQHSSVFRDLFSFPQPDKAETYDGCPVVRISDDPRDVAHMLRFYACTSSVSYFPLENEEVKLSDVIVLARMAHKYQMEKLLAQTLAHLKTVFTDVFPNFWSLDFWVDAHTIDFDNFEAIMVVNLARLTDTLSMLPFALYICCQSEPHKLVNGFTQHGRNECLTAFDAATCVSGRLALSQAQVHYTFQILRWCNYYSSSCEKKSGGSCRSIFNRILDSLGTHEAIADCCPLDPLFTDVNNGVCPGIAELCSKCLLNLRRKDEQERLKIWRNLPTYFGIDVPHWQERNKDEVVKLRYVQEG